MTTSYDVLVVGAGPGGLFAALRAQQSSRSRILLIDSGLDVADRVNALRDVTRTIGDGPGEGEEIITSGLGGAGLFSDGKLCLSPRIGSTVSHRFPVAEVDARQRLIDEVIRSGEDAPLHGADETAAQALADRALRYDLEYLHYPVRHVGSDQLPRMLGRMRQRLIHAGTTIRCRTRCLTIEPPAGPGDPWRAQLAAEEAEPYWVSASHVVLAPGKVGADWMSDVGTALGLPQRPARPKLGFRLEGPKSSFDALLAVASDPKLIWKASDGAEARTHCVCYGGDVVAAEYDDLLLVGGHATSTHHADRSNTAVLAAAPGAAVTVEAARAVVRRINATYGGLVAQSLGDFRAGRRSEADIGALAGDFVPSLPRTAPGDLAQEFPPAVTAALHEFLPRLGGLCPEALNPDNVLYGPAVERWAPRFVVSDEMETPLPQLFLVGDGPGLTGGVIGAADTGWLAGDAIATRLGASIPV